MTHRGYPSPVLASLFILAFGALLLVTDKTQALAQGANTAAFGYTSPYSFNFTCDNLTIGFDASPRNDIGKESEVDPNDESKDVIPYSDWYDKSNAYYDGSPPECWGSSCTDKRSYGPKARLYPRVDAPAGACDANTWKRERLIATAQRYLGYQYQHHYIPDFDPLPIIPDWPSSCPEVKIYYQTAGMSCSTTSTWIYNFGLGIHRHYFCVSKQAEADTPIGCQRDDNTRGNITPLVIGAGDSYETLVKELQTGDLLYIMRENEDKVDHVIMWVGSVGSDPIEQQPLVIDSHDNSPAIKDANGVTIPPGIQIRPFRKDEFYYQRFSHAHRIVGQPCQ